MKEQEIMLKSYKEEIEVLLLTIDVPYYEDEKTRRNFYTYEDVLTKLFNNKREDKDILEIRNYRNNDKITLAVNLTNYINGSKDESEKNNAIEHLKTWLSSGLDVSNDMIEHQIRKGYIYSIPYYENRIRDFENENFIENFIEFFN